MILYSESLLSNVVSLGPVARYAPFWDTPVISPGGMAHDFGDGSEYPLLTRIGFKFRELAQLIKAIVQHYEWNNIKILYSADGHSEISNRCVRAYVCRNSHLYLLELSMCDCHLEYRPTFTTKAFQGSWFESRSRQALLMLP